ncbi:MAG: hypothetical protein C0412_07065 [Flavobacterium sp.]|nr:hypothetical protein [Flavobacterium sp.]
MTPNLVILILTFIIAFFAYYNSNQDEKTKKDIKDNTDSLKSTAKKTIENLNEVNREILESQAQAKKTFEKVNRTYENTFENLAQTEKNYDVTLENLQKTIEAKDATISSQNEIIGQITGGNSYPQVTLKKDGFYLRVVGPYNIPNLKIQIGLIQDCLNISENLTLDYLHGKVTDEIYTVKIQKEYSKLWTVPFSQIIEFKNMKNYLSQHNGQMHAFEIYFESAYKKWGQKIRIVSHNGNWEIADVLYEIPTIQRDNVYNSEKEIYEHVSENFPTLLKAESYKLVPFFNKSPYKEKGGLIIPIKYDHTNGISNYSFDYFIN